MLLELSIKDYILIEDASIEFTSGLNVLTGETGAGKSMLVGALELLLGKKSSGGDVYPGADRAIINAVFDPSACFEQVAGLAKEQGIDLDAGDTLILTREIRSDGRSVARVNRQQVPAQTLRKFSELLFRIHGQNEQLELFSSDYQLGIIDSYSCCDVKEKIGGLYREFRAAEAHLNELRAKSNDSVSKLEFMRFQLEEIDAVRLVDGEDEELEREYEYLMSAESIKDAVTLAGVWLNDGELSAAQGISEVARALRKVSHLSPEAGGLYEHAVQLENAISDFSRATSKFAENMDFDDQRIYEIEKRLDKVNGLKHKHGGSISSVLLSAEILRKEIDIIDNLEFSLEKARCSADSARKEYAAAAAELSAHRKTAAKKLEKEICRQLAELNMPEAALEIEFSESSPSLSGSDEVDIKIATAVGRELRSIKKVVSGGELSRIMLAIQVIIGGKGTMLFDEVDAGISGITASVVGEKLSALSQSVQLVCITHLPQIAVFADNHILIEKSSDDKRTVTDVRALDANGRKFEIARLVGGKEQSDMALQHSEEMLRLANEKKGKNVR